VRRQVVRQSGCIFGRLRLDTSKRALQLGFDRTCGLTVEIEQVIGKAEPGLHRKFAHGYATAGGEVEVLPILDNPPCRSQISIDLPTCLLFGRF
jgi:hypothetical protein